MRSAVETKTTTKGPQSHPREFVLIFPSTPNLFALMINYKIPLTFHNPTKERETLPPSSIHEIFITSRKDKKFSQTHRLPFSIKPFLSLKALKSFLIMASGSKDWDLYQFDLPISKPEFNLRFTGKLFTFFSSGSLSCDVVSRIVNLIVSMLHQTEEKFRYVVINAKNTFSCTISVGMCEGHEFQKINTSLNKNFFQLLQCCT